MIRLINGMPFFTFTLPLALSAYWCLHMAVRLWRGSLNFYEKLGCTVLLAVIVFCVFEALLHLN